MPNHFASYRLEIHATESGKWYSQVWDAEGGDAHLWESNIYEDFADAVQFGKWEIDRRVDAEREELRARKYREDDVPDHGRDVGMSSFKHYI